MSVNVKQNGNLTKVANNTSIAQANWNDRGNTSKNTCIKNQPATLKSMEEVSANTDENALVGANAVKELSDSLGQIGNAELLLRVPSLPAEFTTYNFSKSIDNYRFLYVGGFYANTDISVARFYIVGLVPNATCLYLNELPSSDYMHIQKIENDNIRVNATSTYVGLVVYGIK